MHSTSRRWVAKTASYTVKPITVDRAGTTFSNRGASGSVTFTLPAPTAALEGQWFEFFVIAAQTIVLSCTSKLTVRGSATASSTTLAAEIGTRALVFCDGTTWHVQAVPPTTATAAELNALSGTGLDSTELGYLNGATAGSAVASKALVLGSAKEATGLGRFTFGVFHSTDPNQGILVNPANTGAFRVYGDDGGAALTPTGAVGDLRVVLGRYLLTADQNAVNIRVWGAMGQTKVYDALVNGEQIGGVCGRLEVVQGAGTTTLAGYGISSGVCGILATAGTVLVNTTHVAAGVAAIADIKGTVTQTGKVVGVYVGKYDTTNWSDGTSRAKWSYGLYVDPLSATRGLHVGTIASVVGSGIPQSGTTSINTLCADVAANLVAGVNRNLTVRTYVDATQSTAESDLHVIRGHFKLKASCDLTGDTSVRTAIHGYAEFAGATTVGAGAFFASVLGELWADGNLTGTGLMGGLMARIYGSTGVSASGTVAGVVVCKQWASVPTFTHGLFIQDGSVAVGNDIRLMSGATISSGTGVPGHSAVQGSLYIRTGQTVNEILYLNTNGTTGWTKLGAVA